MAWSIQDREMIPNSPCNSSDGGGVDPSGSQPADAPNSPSKIRGGAAQAAGALKTPASRSKKRVMNAPEMKLFRRELRSHGTTAEGALWNLLKRKQIAGLQFRRQFSIGNRIVDFYCPVLKLAIELDGDYHYHMDMPDRDWERDRELLEKYGIKTLRFENNMVFHDPETIRYLVMQEYENQQPNSPCDSNDGVGVDSAGTQPADVPNSPSKIRGGAAQAAGALKILAQPEGALTPTVPADTTSPGVISRGALVSPPPPALRATSPQAGEEFRSSCSKEGGNQSLNVTI